MDHKNPIKNITKYCDKDTPMIVKCLLHKNEKSLSFGPDNYEMCHSVV